MTDDPRLAEARDTPIADVAERLAIPELKRHSRELVGPCPSCGGKDRFSINPDRGVYNCRSCGGGDVIGLVRLVMACSFADALSWLVGEKPVEIDPAEEERRAKLRAEKKAKAEVHAAREREKAIKAARAIWAEGRAAAGSAVADYLACRGMPDWLCSAPPTCLRYHPALRYTVPSKDGRGWDVIHTGPAMLAAVLAPDGSLTAVHRTWIDVTQPKGKAVITGHDGTQLEVKKILGSKKGCAIRLVPRESFKTLIMGEGIETTLSAFVAAGQSSPATFWAGIDLGNMAGRRILRGEGMKYRGIPDLEEREGEESPHGFLPPPWVTRLIFIQDGDSEPRSTTAKLQAGLRRAKHFNPALRIQIAHPGEGMDLNDVLMNSKDADAND